MLANVIYLLFLMRVIRNNLHGQVFCRCVLEVWAAKACMRSNVYVVTSKPTIPNANGYINFIKNEFLMGFEPNTTEPF